MQFFTDVYASEAPEIDMGGSAMQDSAPSTIISSMMNFAPLIIIFAIFYFLIIRPQQKKVKAHSQMLDSVVKGDKVTTSGGVLGVVKKIDHEESLLTIEIAKNVEIKILRSSVVDITNKSQDDKQ